MRSIRHASYRQEKIELAGTTLDAVTNLPKNLCRLNRAWIETGSFVFFSWARADLLSPAISRDQRLRIPAKTVHNKAEFRIVAGPVHKHPVLIVQEGNHPVFNKLRKLPLIEGYRKPL